MEKMLESANQFRLLHGGDDALPGGQDLGDVAKEEHDKISIVRFDFLRVIYLTVSCKLCRTDMSSSTM